MPTLDVSNAFRPTFGRGWRGVPLRVAAALLFLAGCSTQVVWRRADGVVDPQQLQLDSTACQGDVSKAVMAERNGHLYFGPNGVTSDRQRVMDGCMADRGYVAQRQ